jgi:hypothetical protein
MVAINAQVSTHEQSPEVQFLELCEYRHVGVSVELYLKAGPPAA